MSVPLFIQLYLSFIYPPTHLLRHFVLRPKREIQTTYAAEHRAKIFLILFLFPWSLHSLHKSFQIIPSTANSQGMWAPRILELRIWSSWLVQNTNTSIHGYHWSGVIPGPGNMAAVAGGLEGEGSSEACPLATRGVLQPQGGVGGNLQGLKGPRKSLHP